jgi:hypothetical protein
MEIFDITLKNEKEKTYRFIILLLAALHAIFFIYLLFDELLWKKGVAGLIIIALYSGYRLLISKTAYPRYSFGSGFFFPFAFLFIIPVLNIADMILFLLSTMALQKTVLQFSKTNIEKRSFPVKKYKWDELTNVVLKDNFITLDFKNNKLLQAEIQSININEDAFNTFAKAQLKK